MSERDNHCEKPNNSQTSREGSRSGDSVPEEALKSAIDNTVNTVTGEISRWFHGK